MKTLVRCLDRTVEILMALALAVMVTCVFGNVILRFVFSTGFAPAEEISRLMFVWLIFLGAILAMRKHAHLGVEMLLNILPPAARKACAIVSHALMLYALWLFLSGSWTQTVIGMNIHSTVLGYPTALMAGAGLLCAGSMMLIVAVNLLLIVIGHPKAVIPGINNPGADGDGNPLHAAGQPQGVLE